MTFTETIEPAQSVVNFWRRLNSSVGYFPYQVLIDRNQYGFTSFDVSNNTISLTTETWFVELLEDFSGNPVNLFLPENPSNLKTAYSLHIETDFVINSESEVHPKEFSVYPNPTRDFVNIKLVGADFATHSTVQLFDQYGKIIQETSSVRTTQNSIFKEIDLRSLPAGIYILRIQSGGESFNKKICRL